MQNLQNHIRNYELVERKCNELFEFLLVDDQKLSITTSGNLLVHIVQCIESLAKDLHKELAPLFPKLPKFHAGEQFDYDALGFLDQALGLSKKQIKITSHFSVHTRATISTHIGAKPTKATSMILPTLKTQTLTLLRSMEKPVFHLPYKQKLKLLVLLSYCSPSLKTCLLTKRSHMTNATLLLTRTFLQLPTHAHSLTVLQAQ